MKLLMMFLQAGIVGLVVASNVHWQWTPNTLLASVIGMCFAYFFTIIVPTSVGRLARAVKGGNNSL